MWSDFAVGLQSATCSYINPTNWNKKCRSKCHKNLFQQRNYPWNPSHVMIKSLEIWVLFLLQIRKFLSNSKKQKQKNKLINWFHRIFRVFDFKLFLQYRVSFCVLRSTWCIRFNMSSCFRFSREIWFAPFVTNSSLYVNWYVAGF